MEELFPTPTQPDLSAAEKQADTFDAWSLVRPTPNLAAHISEYRGGAKKRPSADPLGTSGLPDSRRELDGTLVDLCNRLMSLGGETIRGRQLSIEMTLSENGRTLRLLAAYGHVHHRIRQIVGIEGGDGYCWGDLAVGAYDLAARISRRKAICSLFNSSLYSTQTAVMEIAQLAFEFGNTPGGGVQLPDGLDMLLASERITPAKVIDAMVVHLQATADGQAILADIGRRHADVLLSEQLRTDLFNELMSVANKIKTLGRVG